LPLTLWWWRSNDVKELEVTVRRHELAILRRVGLTRSMTNSRLWNQRIFSLETNAGSGCPSPILDRHHIVGEAFLRRCPFLALSVQQGAANGSKRRHKAKPTIRPVNRRVVGSSPT
jgi:hypothetical protein